MTGPSNGQTFDGQTAGHTITLAGYYPSPGASVQVEILTNATLDPTQDASWTLLPVTFTSMAPSFWNDRPAAGLCPARQRRHQPGDPPELPHLSRG